MQERLLQYKRIQQHALDRCVRLSSQGGYTAVAGFGKQLAAEHLDSSFSIAVLNARGGGKPDGSDDANRRGALGAETWVQLRDRDGNKLPEQVDAAPAADIAA